MDESPSLREAMRILVLIVLPLLLGCTSAPAQRPDARQSSAGELVFEGQLDPGQLIEIKGVNGSIRAVRSSSANARVRVTRTSRRSDIDSVELVTVRNDRGYTICALPPSSRGRPNVCEPGERGRISSNNNDVKVEFDVEVPAGVDLSGWISNGRIETEGLSGRVQAHSSNGRINVNGGSEVIAHTTNGSVEIRSSGEATATTTNGRITADLASLARSGEALRFTTSNGSVTLRIPRASDLDVTARTTNGRIRTDIPVTVNEFGRRTLEGRIGNGGRPLEIRTTNGDIRIEEAF